MANNNAPFGLRPARLLTGSDVRQTEYTIASGYNTNIFTGDVVTMTGTGNNIAVSAGGTTNNIGVFVGCVYTPAGSNQRPTWSHYWPASQTATNITAYVIDDPSVVFQAQCDTLNEADVGLLADWDNGTGSTATGMSGRSLAASTGATTGKSVKLLRLAPIPGNAYGAYAVAECMITEHDLKGVVSGVGGE